MKLTTEVRARVIAAVQNHLKTASEYYGQTFSMPTILFNKSGTTAGTANGRRWELNYNPVLLMENQEDFMARTVPHEVAHLIDYKVNPDNHHPEPVWTSRGWRRGKRDVHGADFKFIMERVLGADDSSRCHNYDVSSVKRKRTTYTYRCTCGCGETTELGPKYHAKEQSKPGSIWIRNHGKARLELVTSNTPTPKVEPSSHTRPTPVLPSGGSNKDIARGIYAANRSNRAGFIQACVKAGIKQTTASTYFQNFKSGAWK